MSIDLTTCRECGTYHADPDFCPANPVRKEIRDLVARGNITSAEIKTIRCNSYEWEAIALALDDEAFVERMQYTIDNCSARREKPSSTYDQALQHLWVPELLKRFQRVRDLVVEIRSEMSDDEVTTGALVTVGEIIDASTANCQACSIEAEIGTEENPHPVPERFHVCPVRAIPGGTSVRVIGWGPAHLTQKEPKASIGVSAPFVVVEFDDGGVFSVSRELVRFSS